MDNMDNTILNLNKVILADLPPQLTTLSSLAKVLKYSQQLLNSSIALTLPGQTNKTEQIFLGAIEAVTLGNQLHSSVGDSYNPNLLIRMGLKLLRKVIKDKYLVLAGDYLHIRGSVLASSTGSVQLPRLMSRAQVQLCKQVYLKQQLRNKINKLGYESITIEQILQIAKSRAALTICGIKGIMENRKDLELYSKKLNYKQKQELAQQIGLLSVYRRQLQDFMFNLPKLIRNFIQIKGQDGIYFGEDTLCQYLFYQSTLKTGLRLDLAYLNTVKLISDQIQLLEQKIKSKLGEDFHTFQARFHYALLMYS